MSIFQIDRRSAANFDWWLFLLVLLINAIGIINLTSADAGGELWKKQATFLLFALVVCVAALLIDYKQFEKITNLIYGGCFLLLVGVHFFGGDPIGGARSWYRFEFTSLQPSELMKIAIILAIARYYHRDTHMRVWGMRELIWPAILIGLPVLSIMKEPDMGTVLTILLFSSTMLIFAGIKARIVVVAVLVGLVSFYPVWRWGFKPHQRERIKNFVYPNRDFKDSGYHAFQSKIAVGSGGVLGKGYKKGSMHRLRFLPEQETDFVFGVWAEERGVAGVWAVLILYGLILWQGIKAAREAKDRFGLMLVVGAIALIFWHIFVNVSMVVGIFPIIGVPLPFMTYGGSNLLTFMIAVSLILNVRMRKYFF